MNELKDWHCGRCNTMWRAPEKLPCPECGMTQMGFVHEADSPQCKAMHDNEWKSDSTGVHQ